MRLLPSRPHLAYLAPAFVLVPLLFASARGGWEPPDGAEPTEAVEAPAGVEAPDEIEKPDEVVGPDEVETPATSVAPGGVETPGTDAVAETEVRTRSPAAHVLVPDLRALRRSAAGAGASEYRPERAAFPVRVEGEIVTRRVTALAVLPGGSVPIRAVGLAGRDLVLEHADGTVATGAGGAAGVWEWTAPSEPGIHALRIRSRSGGGEVWIHALVLHPRTAVRDGSLNGYAIGRYMERPRGGLDAYVPPEGFVEVPAEDRDVLVSPHFTLGQFLCKQPGEPRYVAYSRPLVDKLEAVLEELDRTGRGASTLHVMSGFRTPAYNRAIGNTTVYSRHLWGDAADVWVDADGDGEMDDLNDDGRVDLEDARELGRVVERVERRGGPGVRPGGMGLYRRNAHHGPFVHVDARGHRARW